MSTKLRHKGDTSCVPRIVAQKQHEIKVVAFEVHSGVYFVSVSTNLPDFLVPALSQG